MSNAEYCLLTYNEYTILEVMLERCLGRDDSLGAILRRKLARAIVMFPDDIPPTVVTLNSRVIFRVDGNAAETRILAHDEMPGLVGLTIPLSNHRGLAMLGLSEGQSFTLQKPSGSTETITVEQVVYQPEATKLASKAGPQPLQPAASPFVKVVHRRDDRHLQRIQGAPTKAFTDLDDPGPSAA
jgi:regulator of nucleoside diphosphate kinase